MKATDALLKSCGAVPIGSGRTGNGNTKYRLPGGGFFVRSHDAVARSAMNQYRTLVRLIREDAEAATRK